MSWDKLWYLWPLRPPPIEDLTEAESISRLEQSALEKKGRADGEAGPPWMPVQLASWTSLWTMSSESETRHQESRGGLRMCGHQRSRLSRHCHGEFTNRAVTQPSTTVAGPCTAAQPIGEGRSDPKLHSSRLYEKVSAGVPPKERETASRPETRFACGYIVNQTCAQERLRCCDEPLIPAEPEFPHL